MADGCNIGTISRERWPDPYGQGKNISGDVHLSDTTTVFLGGIFREEDFKYDVSTPENIAGEDAAPRKMTRSARLVITPKRYTS